MPIGVRLPDHVDVIAPVTIYDGQGRKIKTVSAEEFRGRSFAEVETCRAHKRRGCPSCRMGGFNTRADRRSKR